MEIAEELAAFARDRRYGQATLDRWRELSDTDARALLCLATELQLSDNQLRDLWDWGDEIATRDHLTLSDVLDLPVLTAVQRRPLARSDKIKLLKATLRRVRFPQLAGAEQRGAELIAALTLPRHVRVELPGNLEGESLRFTVNANSMTALQAGAQALLAAAASPECKALFDLLEDVG